MEKYLVADMYETGSMAIDWTKIPEKFLSSISKNLYNISSVTREGDVVERTVVFILPVKEFSSNVETVEFDDIVLGRELEIFDE